MSPQAKKRTLVVACGLLVTLLGSRVFYFQELFFALLLFAGLFFILLLLACIVAGVWMLYEKGMVYLANWTVKQGHRAIPPMRAMVLSLTPTVKKTAELASAGQQILFDPSSGKLQKWLRSFRTDASHFRSDAERAIKHLRLLLKHG
jgi:hypothetical protein